MEVAESISHREVVRQSVEALGERKSSLAREFYRELFRLDLGMKDIFPGNVVTLNRKFSSMLSTFANVKHLEKIAPSLRQMGGRHFKDYGALVQHFGLFEQALLAALETVLKDGFTTEIRTAWVKVFAEVSRIMCEAAAGELSPSPQESRVEVPLDFLSRIGGAGRVLQVHTRFYDVLFADPWIGQFFFGKHESVLARKQTEFMVAAFGGPNDYQGDTPAFVHMHMFITDEQADYREKLLREAILAEGLSNEIADIWLSVDASFRPGIVKRELSECVMKCRGQLPVSARKPAHMK